METRPYVPRLSCGDRVTFAGPDLHSKTGQQCTIIRILPNPSGRPENQWYDVRFDDESIGRFLEKHYTSASGANKTDAA